jgi:hypothetical protein
MNELKFILAKHAAGATIIETIKAVMAEFGLPLRDAKALVSSHPVWASIVSATTPLHDDLYMMQKDNGSSE